MTTEILGQSTPEVHEYQAEMKKVLQILVHSIYTEREIFLRELISNSSDALSKIQFLSLTEDVIGKEQALEIHISYDEEQKTITIEDAGLGMTKEEIKSHLGTIASSGTLKFLQEFKSAEKKPDTLIGQFGVGFYSVFMVADKVVLETRSYKPNESGWQWVSEGNEQYFLNPVAKETRGTRIVIHLKEDAHEFCNQFRIESIIKKYSNYLPFPVLVKEKVVNQVKALWTLPKEEVSADEYTAFFKQISHDFNPPQLHIHLSIDAPIQYYALLYIPKEITNEVLYAREGKGLSLYAQRIFIQEDNRNLLPPYLRFVRGVIDSEDIPLNVSRESIQQSTLIEKIKKSVTARTLKELQSMADTHADSYQDFWKQYGVLLKEGVTSDFTNKSKLLELLRFNSTLCDDEKPTVGLKDYVSRMREEQKEIFYVVGSSRAALLHNPNLEYFKQNSLEVLLLTDPIDDFMVNDLREYEGKALKDISRSDAAHANQVDSESKLSPDATQSVLELFKKELGDRVIEVVESKRLVGSPCSLVNPKDGMSAHMERMMKTMNKSFQMTKRTLEVNMSHPLVQNLSQLMVQDPQSPFLKECVEQLFSNVLMVEGLLENPLEMLPSINRLLEAAAQHHLKSGK